MATMAELEIDDRVWKHSTSGNPAKGFRRTGGKDSGTVVDKRMQLGIFTLFVVWDDDVAPGAADGRVCHPKPLTKI